MTHHLHAVPTDGITQSSTDRCPVCRRRGVLALVSLLGFPAVGRVKCPHCRPEKGRPAIRIPDFTPPSGDAA